MTVSPFCSPQTVQTVQRGVIMNSKLALFKGKTALLEVISVLDKPADSGNDDDTVAGVEVADCPIAKVKADPVGVGEALAEPKRNNPSESVRAMPAAVLDAPATDLEPETVPVNHLRRRG